MSLLPLLFTSLLFLSPSWAQDDCNLKDEEIKTIAELSEHVKAIEKKIPGNKKKLSINQCEDITNRARAKYQHLAFLVYKNYRNYLNDFLTEATSDIPEVKSFKKLTDYLRGKDGLLQEKEEKLNNLLYSRYKTLRKNIGDKHKESKQAFLPTVDHDCDPQDVKDKPNRGVFDLIYRKPALNIYHNVCAGESYDYNLHPHNQKVITFQTEGGRAMVWFCHQSFDSQIVSSVTRGKKGLERKGPIGNYGPYRETLVKSKANCLAWDLLKNQPFLGDQKQRHVSYEPIRDIEVSDTRVELARKLGKIPLTYAEYISKNPDKLPEAGLKFYPKVVPKECHFWGFYKEALEASPKALVNAADNTWANFDLEN